MVVVGGKGQQGGKSDQMSSHTSTLSEANKEDGSSVNPVVKDLACAILQVCQSIQPRFLRRPLGEDDDKKKKNKEEIQIAKLKDVPAPTPLERWELSLMACTSYSQLFVHLFTFGKDFGIKICVFFLDNLDLIGL